MKLLVVDGNSLINRAFYGIKLLTTKDGQFTNGIYGFINMLNKIMEMEEPEGVAVAFDLRAPTFRHKMYDGYKANRKGMPPELASQMPVLKEWLKLMGYSVLSLEGYEADDILGTLALSCENSGDECVIATGDRDSLQLVSDKVRVLNTVTKMGKPEIIVYTPDEVREKYGVEPQKLIDIKALQGDTSDNIPGVAGIGEKTAQSLIANFGSIDYIYENIETIDVKEGVRAKLIAGKESAFLSRELGRIFREVPVSTNIKDYLIGEMDVQGVTALMTKLEFFALISKMGLSDVKITQSEKNSVAFKEAEYEKIIKSDIVHIFADLEEETLVIANESEYCLCKIEEAKAFLESNTAKNIYDCKTFYKYCENKGIKLNSVKFDAMLAGYLCSPSASSYDLDRLLKEYEVAEPGFRGEVTESISMGAKNALVYNALKEVIEKQNLKSLLEDIELPLSKVLASMENVGFLVDVKGIEAMGKNLEEKLKSLEERIYFLAGSNFNINSPKQLGVVLFENLALPCKKKTKSGYSTNAEVLESLKDEHPIIEEILEYRKLVKLKSTYCDGLVAAADSEGIIHSTLNQTETRTGRISSTEPNLQNIPVKTEEGRELRKYFIANSGKVLVDADYSQIELRVLAHMAQDEKMIGAFRDGVDIHTVTASQVFNMPESMVTPLMRSRAKAVNFGIVYGIGAFSLGKDIGVSRKEAGEYIKNYLSTYSGVADYMERVVDKAKENGFVSTIFSRRRYLPELSSSNGMLRAFGERVARNMPIQGTAADIIKIAMVKVHESLEKELPTARLIMQIHDELIIEADEKDGTKAAEILKREMENACEMCVPLVVDVNIGKTWFDAKG